MSSMTAWVTRPPALRITGASPSWRPRTIAGSTRWSRQLTITTWAAAGPSGAGVYVRANCSLRSSSGVILVIFGSRFRVVWSVSSAGGDGCTHAVADRDLTNRRCELVRGLAGSQVAAGKGQDPGVGHAFAGGLDLLVLIWVLFATADVDVDHSVERVRDRCEVPAPRLAAMFADESGGAVNEGRSVPADDRRPQLGQLGR